jgi:hypothetical protein
VSTQRAVQLLALATFAVFLAKPFRHGWTRDEADFPSYYTAAVLVRQHVPLRNYYDWSWFARRMNYAGYEKQLGAYSGQAPLTVLPFLPMATLPSQRAKQVWLVMNLAFLAMTLWMLSRVTRFRVEHIWLVLFAGYYALANNFVIGQYYVFLLWLLTLTFYWTQRGRPAAAGVVAGVAFALKLYAGPFLLFFAARRNWRAVAGMLAALTASGLVAVAMFGAADVWYFLTQVLPRLLEGNAVNFYHPGNPTVSTALHRLFMKDSELNPAPLLDSPFLFLFLQRAVPLAILGFATVGLIMSGKENARRDFAWFLVAVMLISTSASSYAFVLLALAVVLLMEDASVRTRVAVIAWYMLISYPLPLRELFPKVWLLVAMYVAVGVSYWGHIPRRILLGTAACVVFVALIDARRHIASFREEPAQHLERVSAEGAALFASSPAVTRAGLFYQAMRRDRYVLKRVANGRTDTLAFDGHALEPVALSPNGPIQFELVARRTSTMMLLDPQTLRTSVASSIALVHRDSAISPDGRWVAYVPNKDPRHVWLREVATGRATELTRGNCNSADPAWEPSSQSIIVASDCGRPFGLPVLYRVRAP